MKTRSPTTRIRARSTTVHMKSRVFISLGDKNRAVPDQEVLTDVFAGQLIRPYFETAYITYTYANDTLAFDDREVPQFAVVLDYLLADDGSTLTDDDGNSLEAD